MTDPYERLAELAETELAHVRAGELDALAAIHAARDKLIARLPDRPPPSARPALERAAAAQDATTALLATAHGDIAAQLQHLHRGRRAARSYTPALTPPSPSLDHPA